jgi:hypothetical protein
VGKTAKSGKGRDDGTSVVNFADFAAFADFAVFADSPDMPASNTA